MTLTTHAILGGAIGTTVGHPALGFALGFLSHLLVDMIPHGDSGIADNFYVHKRRRTHAVAYVSIDAIIAILLTLLLANTKLIHLESFSWGVAGGVLPDLLVGIFVLTKTKYLAWFHQVHFLFHDFFLKRRGRDVKLPFSLAGQLIFIFLLQRLIR